MAAGAPRGDFKLVLNAVNQAQVPAIVAELVDILQIDRTTAMAAVQNVPIVLLGGMTRQQAANVRTYLARLTKLGAQLGLTAEPLGRAKQIRLPASPAAIRRPANVFTCPTCGERFLVQRWQPAPLPAPVPAPAPPQPVPAAPPAAAAPPAPADEAIPEAEPLEAEPLEPDALEAEALEAEPLEAEALEAERVEEEAPLEAVEAVDAEEFAFAEVEEEAEEAPEAEPPPAQPAPLPAAEPLALEVAEPVELPPAQAAPAPPAPEPQPAPEPPKPQPAAMPQPRPAPAPKPAPASKPAAKAPAGPRYDVSVARAAGPKQAKLADLLVERQGMDPDEADKQCKRTVVLVCKDATSAEADEWRKALLAIGLKPRIRKR